MTYKELDEKINQTIPKYKDYPKDLIGYQFNVDVINFLLSNRENGLPEPKGEIETYLFDLAKHVEDQFRNYDKIKTKGIYCQSQYLMTGIYLPYGWEALKEFDINRDKLLFQKLIELYILERFTYPNIINELESNRNSKQGYVISFFDTFFRLSQKVNIKIESFKLREQFWYEILKNAKERLESSKYLDQNSIYKCDLFLDRIFEIYKADRFLKGLNIWLDKFKDVEHLFPLTFLQNYDVREQTFGILKDHYLDKLEKKYPNPPIELIDEIINKDLVNVKSQAIRDRIIIESDKNESQLYAQKRYLKVNTNAKLRAEYLFIQSLKSFDLKNEVSELDSDSRKLTIWFCLGTDLGIFKNDKEGFKLLAKHFKVSKNQTNKSLDEGTLKSNKSYFSNEVNGIREQLKKLNDINNLIKKNT